MSPRFPRVPTALSAFPRVRMRRNRREPWSRALVAENVLTPADLIWPVFVIEGKGEVVAVDSMPGVVRHTIDQLPAAVGEAKALDIPAIAIFPMTPEDRKDVEGTEATNPDNLVCRAIDAVKSAHPEIGVICDVALDPYTSHGHDGVIRNDYVDNDDTLAILAQQALVQAKAGCDVIAPSDMMDGRVGVIRDALDQEGFDAVRIMAYSAKYASGFYGPFRDAVGSSTSLKGDKKTYQMDPANGDEAIRE
ncbi:MAG: porphobilinogen synthase, partial [Alphaproteobacteria bacterium]|nr:porphobilinogen synthase [Alphaproteobacteria bacterium]